MQVHLVLFCSVIITVVIPTSYGDDCSRWDKNANNTLPSAIVDYVMKHIKQFIPVATMNKDIFDIDSAMGDFKRGLQNDDLHWHITELIKANGYPVEEHEVTTSDGYILGMFRIPGNGSVVFLMHELFGSSDDFVTSGKGHALAFELAAAGYDVWFGNARGTVHSRRNKNLSPDCAEFWNFSWDDIGRKDLPAMIDYVLQTTSRKTLQYIGYSQGTTSFFVMCSEMPEYNEKISIMISLASVAWISHTTNPIFQVVALFLSFFPHNESLFQLLFGYEIVPRNDITNAITDIACRTPETALIFCNNPVSLAFGFDYPQVNATYLPRVYAHVPAGCSARQLLHYGQGVLSGKFRQYDYGLTENLKKYGSAEPPDYPVHKISTRVVIFQAEIDNVAATEDVKILIKNLSNFNMSDYYKIPFKLFGHFDYIIANDLKTLVHDKILEFLRNN